MSLRNDIDPGGLLEYSVVFSDRSLNHMSQLFQQVMLDISSMLKKPTQCRGRIGYSWWRYFQYGVSSSTICQG